MWCAYEDNKIIDYDTGQVIDISWRDFLFKRDKYIQIGKGEPVKAEDAVIGAVTVGRHLSDYITSSVMRVGMLSIKNTNVVLVYYSKLDYLFYKHIVEVKEFNREDKVLELVFIPDHMYWYKNGVVYRRSSGSDKYFMTLYLWVEKYGLPTSDMLYFYSDGNKCVGIRFDNDVQIFMAKAKMLRG